MNPKDKLNKIDLELKESQKRFHALTESAVDSIIIINSLSEIVFWNTSASKLFGFSKEEAEGQSVNIIIPPKYEHAHYKGVESYLKTRNAKLIGKTIEIEAKKKDKSIFPIELSLSCWVSNNETFFCAIIRDITERKLTEKLLKKSLDQKESLLKEVHHRVKNNLQIITSLLNLQSNIIDNNQLKVIFRDSQDRINSMALIHEMLYKTDNFDKINYFDYLKQLIPNLIVALHGSDNNINLKIEPSYIYFSISTSITLGLIVNEIVTNSLKHAFKNGEAGVLTVQLKKLKAPNYVLEIGDDGIGFSDDKDSKSKGSLGLILIHDLSAQLNGSIKKDHSKKGTNYIISFQDIK